MQKEEKKTEAWVKSITDDDGEVWPASSSQQLMSDP